MFVQFFGLFGFIFIVLQYLQLIRGDSARSSVAVAARLGGAAAAQARTAFTDGMHLALFIAAGIVAVAAVAVAVLLRGHDRVPTENTARTRVPVRSEEPEASRFAAAGRPAA